MTINLNKTRSINLSKESKTSKVQVQLGWDPAPVKSLFGSSSNKIDLDASILCLSNGSLIAGKDSVVYFGHLYNQNKSICHNGDNRSGEGDGPDETIDVDLQALPAQVDELVIVINSFSGQTFGAVQREFMNICDEKSVVVKYEPDTTPEADNAKSLIVGNITKDSSNEWTINAIGKFLTAGRLEDLKKLVNAGGHR